jgi:hypothetical protein
MRADNMQMLPAPLMQLFGGGRISTLTAHLRVRNISMAVVVWWLALGLGLQSAV